MADSEFVDLGLSVKWATVLKGSACRLPSYDDWLELKDNCKWTQESVNGHDGYRVTGPNGNSIFLPYAGYRSGQIRSNVGIDGCYWLGQTQGDDEAYVISLNRLHQSVGQMLRAMGGSVRSCPEGDVCEAKRPVGLKPWALAPSRGASDGQINSNPGRGGIQESPSCHVKAAF